METIIYFVTALGAYLIGGWNPAITISKAVYKKDIRTMGSGNPGFTNFKRCFGSAAWIVLALDLSKGALAVLSGALLFAREGLNYEFGAVYTGFFAVLGHSYPVWYGLKGGKGFLVALSTLFIADWRVGLISAAVMIVLLLSTSYMSLSTVTSLLAAPFLFLAFGAERAVIILYAVTALFVLYRHRENVKRLFSGTESKFRLGSH